MFKIIIISIILLFGCIFVFEKLDPNLNTSNDTSIIVSSEDNKRSITIEGEIALPGIYKMELTNTIEDLINSAGGLLESADQDAFFLDVVIGEFEYDSFYVASVTTYTNTCEVVTNVEKININDATATEIATINYISYALAEKIVTYREENGDFRTLEDIMHVSGIGTATYQRVRDYIVLK